MGKVFFKEEQKFNQWWLWLLMIITFLSVAVPFGYAVYSQEVLDKPFGDNPMSTEGLINVGAFSLLLFGLIILLFYVFKLKTKITNEALFVSFPPAINKWKKFAPDEIEKFEVRKYNAFKEYGGYGIKFRRRYGKCYNVSGNLGLQLYLKNGKKVLIGTRRKQAISYAMEKLMNQDGKKRIQNKKAE